ncbi:TPA: peptide chain release factor N(5)-glutamine methyltransferase, partial [Escherichia coli]|nr:peptide chain release factor N(5)-glutamine methyltransferase [Escherichia coli]
MEYQHWLREAISQLQASESPRRDAEILLEHVTGRGRTFILAFGETQLTDEQCQQLDALLTRRRDGEPIAHLTGVREFWSLPLFVSPATLIPRPDTECLVEQALARLPEQPCRILDLGTGTGAIALALASERPDCEITAVDRMPDAVSLAQRNAQHLAIKNIHILQSDWFSALAGQQFAMIVSNPPYIDEQDPHLQQGDVRFEPLTALVAADSGMADIVHIIEQSRNALVSGGFLLLEHGWQQGEAVRQAFIF